MTKYEQMWETIYQVMALYDFAYSIQEIAEITGRKKSSVQYILWKCGYEKDGKIPGKAAWKKNGYDKQWERIRQMFHPEAEERRSK